MISSEVKDSRFRSIAGIFCIWGLQFCVVDSSTGVGIKLSFLAGFAPEPMDFSSDETMVVISIGRLFCMSPNESDMRFSLLCISVPSSEFIAWFIMRSSLSIEVDDCNVSSP